MTHLELVDYVEARLPRHGLPRHQRWDLIDGWGCPEYNLWCEDEDMWHVWTTQEEEDPRLTEHRMIPGRKVPAMVEIARRVYMALKLTGGV